MGGEDFYCEDFDEEKMICTNPDCESYNEEHNCNCDFFMTKADSKALYENYARRIARKESNTLTPKNDKKQPTKQECE